MFKTKIKPAPKAKIKDVRRITPETTRLFLLDRWNAIKDIVLRKSRIVGKDYCESSSIHCYQYIVDDTMENWERWIWWTLHAISAVVAFWVMWVAGSDAILSPVALTRTPIGAPVNTIPHPGVALCSLNRISKKRATNFARTLIANKSLHYSINEMVDMLSYLGSVYDFELPKSNQLEKLHSIMKPYNLDLVMQMLSPTCYDLVKRCLWRSEPVDCMSIFQTRKTIDGYCCTFNYQRESDVVDSNSTSAGLDYEQLKLAPGLERGLSVLIDPQLDDYLYTTMPNEGVKILLFNPLDFPDIQSGGCLQAMLSPQTELYVTLDATSIDGSEDVKSIDPLVRGCSFDFESSRFKDSLSDCILNCRIKNIRKICGCIPFFLPSKSKDDICDLTDILCLNRWKDIWKEIWSDEEFLDVNGDIDETAPIPPCNECLPTCVERTFKAFQHTIPLQPNNLNALPDSEKAILKRSVVFKDHSVVHIFISKDTVLHLQYSDLSAWYSLLSTMGGVCGLVLGASLISVVEILYYLIGGPRVKLYRRQPVMRQLYWQELRNYRTI